MSDPKRMALDSIFQFRIGDLVAMKDTSRPAWRILGRSVTEHVGGVVLPEYQIRPDATSDTRWLKECEIKRADPEPAK